MTEIDVVTVPLLKEKKVLLVKLNTFNEVLKVMNQAKNQMGDLLVAFEYMDAYAYKAIES